MYEFSKVLLGVTLPEPFGPAGHVGAVFRQQNVVLLVLRNVAGRKSDVLYLRCS